MNSFKTVNYSKSSGFMLTYWLKCSGLLAVIVDDYFVWDLVIYLKFLRNVRIFTFRVLCRL